MKEKSKPGYEDFMKRVNDDIANLKEKLDSECANFKDKFDRALSKGKITEKQHTDCCDICGTYHQDCTSCIELLENCKFRSEIDYQIKKKVIEKVITLLKAEVQENITQAIAETLGV